ncbi:MAG: ATP-binding protein [Lachnospiraceae bacterium]|nr:ATP-binding protein [Lachnospiraceae bacterium]
MAEKYQQSLLEGKGKGDTMGVYLNPGKKGFETILNGTYIDKTGLIDYINETIDTPRKLTCFSRPRRFGKSFAAKMLCAYYDRSCDSRDLFGGLRISREKSFDSNLNRFDVIYLDITWFISRSKSRGTSILKDIQDAVINELRETFPACVSANEVYLPDAMLNVSHKMKRKFFVIIDEWDALFREAKDDKKLQKEYVQLLRGLFKGGTVTDEMIAGAYMTGILPIKKYGTQSALTDFREFTMTRPAKLAEYVGFTEPEVRMLCTKYHMDFENMRTWYDGYSFSRIQHVYSPNSVMNALQDEEFQNYWTESETYESLTDYITQDYDGLKKAIVQMLGGQHIPVDISTFQNDLTSFKSKDDVITLLIHLGYLAYDDAQKEVYIPNLEVADAFRSAVKGSKWTEVNKSLSLSDKLLKATINGDAEMVAEALELAHETCASHLEYNDENSLSCAIQLAYYTARNNYEIFRELPTGKGFADYAFIPRKGVELPAMVIELKYNKSADSAIKQIHDNHYEGKLKGIRGKVLLVGINYDKEAKGEGRKRHTCIIEEI